MGNPAKDASIRRQKQARERVAESYTPIVLWVKSEDGRLKESDTLHSPEEMLRRKLRDIASDTLFMRAATQNEPYSKVVTEFDEEWEDI